MQHIIYDRMGECTQAEVDRLCRILPRHRVEQALKYKHLFGQFCCLKSYELLLELGLPQTPFQFNQYGKPFIIDAPFFSISHCKEAIAVCTSEYPVGIDIESIRNADSALIERTMNADEQKYISISGNENKAFIELWTRKEAYLKYKGTGIVDDLHSVLTNIEKSVNLQTFCLENKHYVWSVCTQLIIEP